MNIIKTLINAAVSEPAEFFGSVAFLVSLSVILYFGLVILA